MSVTDTIPPSSLDVLKDALKDTPVEPVTPNGHVEVVDGAHTQPNGVSTSAVTPAEPVVIIADAQPADVTATLLPKPNHHSEHNHIDNTNANTTPTGIIENKTADSSSNVTKETVVYAVTETEEKKATDSGGSKGVSVDLVVLEEKETHHEQTFITTPIDHDSANTTTTTTTSTTTTTVTASSSSYVPADSSGITPASGPPLVHARSVSNNSNNSNNSNSNISGSNSLNNSSSNIHTNNMPPSELKSSARNLRHSVLGIEMEDEIDEHGVKVRKVKRKERSHSRIVLHHKKNVIGETIYKGHQSWVLMLNIQTGIRNAVGRGHSRSTVTAPKSPLVLPPPGTTPPTGTNVATPSPTPKSPIEFLGPNNFENIAEFYASPKVLNFPPEGSANTIPHNTGAFKFKDYCPFAFRFLRHRFGIDTADYMVSLCNTQKNGENALRELPTPGKSGSLFFFSHDMRFILKTIPKSEAKLLRSILPSYVDHIANDENTLLPKFFGLHRVKPHRGRQVRFLVMNNIFQTRKTIHERYDLKGSTLGRAASEEEKKKDTVTLKDLDFRQRHVKIQIGPDKRNALVDQLLRDVKFLAKLNIMDYSLLIGVHNIEKDDGYISDPPSPKLTHIPKHGTPHDLNHEYFHSIFQENDGGMRAIDEGGVATGKIYYMGIIDILMMYSLRKQVEHAYKTLRYGKSEEISSVSPEEYATRFYEFVSTSIT